ncbi:2-amino-4-hydroxy-6-hydroxymethyldihydropteridine diphosphokinase [Altericroceibacterium endophyticum]|uniref:2-amino-4-hydroxy-6- hydroxymethyldihydropteridine diphosphokinase n=1 Tax=Altericroceibacterium endophyticum TaxID=1808508 RepID=UPI001EEE6573|nr:2-amino-4-hydroxy-6-hydroxymethyldihydropteridine diphosphokinase [Altericroceibacterium endophyticum]
MNHLYLIALGSNQRHPRYGAPRAILSAALEELSAANIDVLAQSHWIDSAPIGPSLRRYANGAAVISTGLSPRELLTELKQVEARFGRNNAGQRWRSRPLDLDIILWDKGFFSDEALTIPHAEFRGRFFVTGPAAEIAPDWRDPLTGFSLRQLHARLTRPRSLPR